MNDSQITHILSWTERLKKEGVYEIDFFDGSTKFYCGKNALNDFLQEEKVFKTYSSIDINYDKSNNGVILSVGSSFLHDKARAESFKIKREYATCPVPLSNDSFMTDRYSGTPGRTATIIKFPVAVILDWGLCARRGFDKNMGGIGETAGLITSVYDYYQIRHKKCPEKIFNRIIQFVDNLFNACCSSTAGEHFIPHLGAALTAKGLIMRLNGDNAIGAGCDHMISYYLQMKGIRRAHGILVFMGMLICLIIINKTLFHHYLELAIKIGYMGREEIEILLDLDYIELLLKSPLTRPHRPTFLANINKKIAKEIGKRIKKDLLNHV